MSAFTFNNLPRAYGLYEPGVSLSADGRTLVYTSFVDGARLGNVIILDTGTGASRLVTGGAGSFLAASDNYAPALAANGSAVAFTTAASDRVAPDRIAVADLATGAIRFASTSASGAAGNGDSQFASISADGRFVAFDSAASNLVAGDTNGVNDVFVKDMHSGAVRRVSLTAAGAQLQRDAVGAEISADGNVVLFRSLQDVATGASAGSYHLYASNLASGALTLVSPGVTGGAALSADGRYVVYAAPSTPGTDLNAGCDVFRKDLATGATVLVSASAGSVPGAGWNADPAISADGRFVSFGYETRDMSVISSSPMNEIFVRDMLTGALTQVSAGAEPGQGSFHPALSADGSQLVFARYAGTLGASYDVTWDVLMTRLEVDSSAAARGTAGNDVFASTAANDNWAAGAGLDVAVYRGKMGEYEIRNGASVQVSDRASARDGADTLTGVERLRFADGMVALDTGAGDIAGQAYRIYQAAFNRTPDAGGVGFWIGAMDRGQVLAGVAGGFVKSAEFIALYGASPSNASVVEKLYLNVLHRPGEAAGVAYWTGVLDGGHASVPEVLAGFSESAENIAGLVGVLANGFFYTPFG